MITRVPEQNENKQGRQSSIHHLINVIFLNCLRTSATSLFGCPIYRNPRSIYFKTNFHLTLLLLLASLLQPDHSVSFTSLILKFLTFPPSPTSFKNSLWEPDRLSVQRKSIPSAGARYFVLISPLSQ